MAEEIGGCILWRTKRHGLAIMREFEVFSFDRKPFRADHERIELASFCGKVGLASGEGPRPQNDPKRPFHEAAKKLSKSAAGRGSYGFGARRRAMSCLALHEATHPRVTFQVCPQQPTSISRSFSFLR